ncbi:MAG: ParB/RepB/Spo0J family partition protein [Planctomycetes bacterium]|nr:ParB/RepB/Spo0J family partition protein [Planctomycetota bacterium]
MKILSLALKSLAPHPDNPRGPIGAADVAELAASITANGLLSPLVVTPAPKAADRYTVLAGHRRLMALKSLGREEAQCVVLEAAEADATSVMLADNIHRVDLDPVRAGGLVDTYLAEHPEATVDDFARKVGKTRRWVAQARALGMLSPAWRKRRDNEKDPASRLSLAQLVAIASLHPDAQERLARELKQEWQFEQFDNLVAEETRRLADAPWKLDDAAVLKKAGPCTKCPKTSMGTPGLFEDGDPGDVSKAVCRDGGCFAAKLVAHRVAEIQAARAEHGGSCIVLGNAPSDTFYQGIPDDLRRALAEIDVQIESSYDYRAAKAGAGKPAYVLTGKKAGQVIRVERASPASRASSSGAGDTKPSKPAEEQREAKRLRIAFKACMPLVRALPAPKPALVLGLLRAYGYGEGRGEDLGHRRKVVAATTSVDEFVEAAWPELRSTIEMRFDVFSSTIAEEREPELRWLADLLGVDLAAQEAAALAEVPPPRPRGRPRKNPPAAPPTAKRSRKAGTKARKRKAVAP